MKWISVEEKLPELPERLSWPDGPNRHWVSEPVLVWDANYKQHSVAEMFRTNDGPEVNWNQVYGSSLDEITHWMPLPEPPKP